MLIQNANLINGRATGGRGGDGTNAGSTNSGSGGGGAGFTSTYTGTDASGGTPGTGGGYAGSYGGTGLYGAGGGGTQGGSSGSYYYYPGSGGFGGGGGGSGGSARYVSTYRGTDTYDYTAGGGGGGGSLGAGGALYVAGGSVTLSNVTFNGNAAVGGAGGNGGTMTFNRMDNISVANTISGTGSVVQTGSGKTQLTGLNTYTGATLINNGTLQVHADGALAATNMVQVSNNGTLLLDGVGATGTNRLNDNASVVLDAGKIVLANGASERNGTTSVTPGMGALTLRSNSIIDFGAGSGSLLAFANSSDASTTPVSWTANSLLLIYNWNGTPAVGGGSDQLYFGTDNSGLSASQLNQVVFYSDAGLTQLGSGNILASSEIVPVPEPATILGGLLTGGVAAYYQRRSLRRLVRGIWKKKGQVALPV